MSTKAEERTADQDRAHAQAIATHEWRLRQPARKARRRMAGASRLANRSHR